MKVGVHVPSLNVSVSVGVPLCAGSFVNKCSKDLTEPSV